MGDFGFKGVKVEEMQQSSTAPFNRKSMPEVSTCWKTMERGNGGDPVQVQIGMKVKEG